MITHLEGWHHGAGRDLESLENEGPDKHGDNERENNRFNPFPDLTLLLLAFLHHVPVSLLRMGLSNRRKIRP